MVCKNVLLHFDEAQCTSVLQMFHKTLQPGGILVMEQTQKLPHGLVPLFEQVAPCAAVYRKVDRVAVSDRGVDGVPAPHQKCRAEIADLALTSATCRSAPA